MGEKWLGVVTAAHLINIVFLEQIDNEQFELRDDRTWKLQKGPRPEGYKVLFETAENYLKENHINKVVIKGSAVNQGGTKLSNLYAAELRGVIITAACSAGCLVYTPTKSYISKQYGERKADEYIQDNTFWEEQIDGSLRKGNREAALLVLATKGIQNE